MAAAATAVATGLREQDMRRLVDRLVKQTGTWPTSQFVVVLMYCSVNPRQDQRQTATGASHLIVAMRVHQVGRVALQLQPTMDGLRVVVCTRGKEWTHSVSQPPMQHAINS